MCEGVSVVLCEGVNVVVCEDVSVVVCGGRHRIARQRDGRRTGSVGRKVSGWT